MLRILSMRVKRRSCMYRILMAMTGLLGICFLLSMISALSNRSLPDEDTSGRLNTVDKARLLESLQLKTKLGNQVWSGWGDMEIPIIVWNRSYEFLFNYNGKAPSGWLKITDDDIN